MAIMPGAIFREVGYHRTPLTVVNRVNLHVAVSEADSLFGFFNRPNQVCSHFYVRRDGTTEQYVDTTYRAAADLQGNDATISVETQGGVSDPNGEPWTDAQVAALARLWAWARDTHGIVDQIATSSRIGPESRGLSWHRLGIDPWRVSGGMRYSNARGKVCPGDAKIAQIPTIFAAASGGSGGTTSPAPAPAAPASDPAPWGHVDVDGYLGSQTITALQHRFGTTADGVISSQSAMWRGDNPGITGGVEWVGKTNARGSQLVSAMQRWSGVDDDGLLGPITISSWQTKLGTPVDGCISAPSALVTEIQRRLNAGTL